MRTCYYHFCRENKKNKTNELDINLPVDVVLADVVPSPATKQQYLQKNNLMTSIIIQTFGL